MLLLRLPVSIMELCAAALLLRRWLRRLSPIGRVEMQRGQPRLLWSHACPPERRAGSYIFPNRIPAPARNQSNLLIVQKLARSAFSMGLHGLMDATVNYD